MYTDYKREFPDFKKNLEHATATGVVKSFDKPKKLLKLFGRVIERQGWFSDGRLKTLAAEAFKTLNNVSFSKEKKTRKFKEKYEPVKARYNAILKENAPKPEAPKQEAPKPEARKPEASKQEAPKPAAPRQKAADDLQWDFCGCDSSDAAHPQWHYFDRIFSDVASYSNCMFHCLNNPMNNPLSPIVPAELKRLREYTNNLSFMGITGHFSKDNRAQLNISSHEALAKLENAFYVKGLSEVRSQYKKLALLLHPDKTKQFSEDTKKYLGELFGYLNHYYALAGQSKV